MASVCTAVPAGPAGALEPRPDTEFVDVTADGVKGNGAWAATLAAAGRAQYTPARRTPTDVAVASQYTPKWHTPTGRHVVGPGAPCAE